MIKSKKFSFSSTIGDDIEVDVSGEWCPPEKDIGYSGNYYIDEITLPSHSTNLTSVLSVGTLARLIEEGFNKGSENG